MYNLNTSCLLAFHNQTETLVVVTKVRLLNKKTLIVFELIRLDLVGKLGAFNTPIDWVAVHDVDAYAVEIILVLVVQIVVKKDLPLLIIVII
jgi:hypothetical protein